MNVTFGFHPPKSDLFIFVRFIISNFYFSDNSVFICFSHGQFYHHLSLTSFYQVLIPSYSIISLQSASVHYRKKCHQSVKIAFQLTESRKVWMSLSFHDTHKFWLQHLYLFSFGFIVYIRLNLYLLILNVR